MVSTQRPLEIRLLGPFEVVAGDEVLPMGGPKQRAVFAALTLSANRLVPVSELGEALWGVDETIDRRHSLQQQMSSLRKVLSDAAVADQVTITSDGPGYRMAVARTAVDVFKFDALRTTARLSSQQGDATGAAQSLTEAIGLWRGEPLVDFVDREWFANHARSLAEDRVLATEELVEVRLALGEHRQLVSELEALVFSEPYRERLWAQLMLALYRSDRQAEALSAFARARTTLVDELGIEPGDALRRLESRILDQDPALKHAGEPSVSMGNQDTFHVGGDVVTYIQLPDGQQVHLGASSVLLGRGPSCHARLDDSRVSRRHAKIEPDADQYVVVDLDSTNGTSLNGNRVARATLSHGDVVSLGGVEVMFHRA